MDCEHQHQSFKSFPRRSQTLRNDRCQNILYKAVFEHFIEIKWIVAFLLTSKSFQNSSFGANFVVNFAVDENSIRLLDSVLSPSSCFSLQFVPSLHIAQKADIRSSVVTDRSAQLDPVNRRIANFVDEMLKTKYLRLQLQSLRLDSARSEACAFFSSASSTNSWPQLRHLTLQKCDLTNERIEAICNNAPQLRTVHFPANSISIVGLEHISKLSGVTSLNLCGSYAITNAGLELLPKLSRLTALDLSYCNFADAGLEQISKLSRITSLNLTYSRVTDARLAHVAKLSDMRSLDLSACQSITDRGLQLVAEALPGLTSLNLHLCRLITGVGLEHAANPSRITSLNLSFCKEITDAGLQAVSKLAAITSLDLSECGMITDVGLEHIAKLSRLAAVDLVNCDKITDAGLQHIAKLSSITSLNLFRCNNITDAGLAHVAKLSSITALNLSNCDKITTVGMKCIAKLANLASLELKACKMVAPKAKKMLKAALPNCNIVD